MIIETNRYFIKRIYFQKLEFVLLLAENGYEALKVCELEKPDLIITELVMPVMDGMDVSTKLRKNPETSDIPIIALSADLPETSR